MPEEYMPAFYEAVGILMNEQRLKILGLLATEERTFGELVAQLHMKPALVLRHLIKLQKVGAVKKHIERDVYRYGVSTKALQVLNKTLFASATKSSVSNAAGLDAKEREVLEKFFEGTRLKTIPAGRENLEIIVRWFARQFEPGVRYREDEVNKIIQRHYHDYAFFKKDMVGRGLMRREHGIFWRVE